MPRKLRRSTERPKRPVRGPAEAERLHPREREAWQRSLEALGRMRRLGISLTRAARDVETTPDTVKHYAGSAVSKHGRRYVVSPSDRLYRPLQFPTERGRITLHTTSSRTATRVAEYWAAVHRYLATGDRRALLPFHGKSVRVGKLGRPFITSLRILERLAAAGEVQFEDLYAGVS